MSVDPEDDSRSMVRPFPRPGPRLQLAGDHIIVLLKLHAVGETESQGQGRPLLFHRSAFGRLA